MGPDTGQKRLAADHGTRSVRPVGPACRRRWRAAPPHHPTCGNHRTRRRGSSRKSPNA
jgi:hypothetical protein